MNFFSVKINVFLFFFPVTDAEAIEAYFGRFDEMFFQFCDKELLKINTFFSGKHRLWPEGTCFVKIYMISVSSVIR